MCDVYEYSGYSLASLAASRDDAPMRRPARRLWLLPTAALALLAIAGVGITIPLGFAFFVWLHPAYQWDQVMIERWDVMQETFRMIDVAIAEADAELQRDIREQQKWDEQWARSWEETIEAMRLDPSAAPPPPPDKPKR